MTRSIGSRDRRDGEDRLVLTRTFHASIDDVWAAVTDSERLARWFGPWRGDPSEGRVEVCMAFEDGAPWEPYHIEICEPPQRLRVRTGLDDLSQNWTLDLSLAETAGSTTLRFAQVLTPHVDVSDVGPGWEYYLDRLVESVDTGTVSTIEWDADYLELGPAYRQRFGTA